VSYSKFVCCCRSLALLLGTGMTAMSAHGQTVAAATPQVVPDSSVPPWAVRTGRPPLDEWKQPGNPRPRTPPPAGLYVAIGDSITFGYGATRNCQAFPAHPVDIDAFCPDGTSYATRVAKGVRDAGIAGHFMDLGINGADVSRILRDELPLLPAEATLITIYVGTNDSRGVTKNPVNVVVEKYKRKFEERLATIHAKAPNARIILLNFPNERVLGEELMATYHTPSEALPKYEVVSQSLDTFINAHYPQYPVVDTVCLPESYNVDLLYRLSVHPNDEGASILAKAVLKVIKSPNPSAPPESCKWLSADPTDGELN
jgi:lysophospholipase L1-like esterase